MIKENTIKNNKNILKINNEDHLFLLLFQSNKGFIFSPLFFTKSIYTSIKIQQITTIYIKIIIFLILKCKFNFKNII